MTQSGQGEEPQYPAARPAHEGVVLPADGGEPLISGGLPDQTVPAGGLPWGQPWGPGQDGAGAGGPGQGGYGDGSYGDGSQEGPSYGDGSQGGPSYGDPSPGDAPYGGPAPYAEGSAAWAQQPGATPASPAGSPPAGVDEGATQYIPPVPADPGAADEGATQLIPPVPGQNGPPGPMPGTDAAAAGPGFPPAQGAHAAPSPGAHAAPTAPSGPPAYAPQDPAPGLPGALPPEQPVDATQFLGRRSDVPQQAPPAHRAPQPSAAAGADPDVEATQYIAPVPAQPTGAPYGIRPGAPGDRQPPPEFDSLFRNEPAPGGDGTDSTQQMPRFEAPAPHRSPDPGGEPPRGRAANRRAASEGSSSTGSKVPMLAAIGVAIALVGLGAGVLINMAGGDDSSDEPRTVAATDPTKKSEPSPSPTADPAKEQAEQLDKLLEDSNNSRAAVIRSVELIKSCKNLPQAARDLRGAARQRTSLVTRLAELKVDKIPDNARLTASLNRAWKASASADNHYAAWAGETCKGKGKNKKAGQTPHKRSGDRQSGVASAAKKQAVGIWNPLATKYQLTQRQPVDL
ncbi:hypothetical protein DY218_12470 [Streptomyces triticagri]|uniref:Uncharacterized protein n=1 Tax=Streptomyces triticagri TaxID=2293568 RepID=A0A372M611_9ACTN|nr:hypothetical protein [Streptomyces triticagri]RFU86374.1 hypothetical protein DY218_12470 [Streptomyces triticagri]